MKASLKLPPFLSAPLTAASSRLSRGYQRVCGIDVGGSAISFACMSQQGGQWKVDRFIYESVSYNEIANSVFEQLSMDSFEIYSKHLDALVKREKLAGQNVAISLPVSAAIIKVVTLPQMSDEELNAAIETRTLWENVVQLTDKIFEYSIYWDIVGRDDEKETFDILFVAAKYDDIELYRALLTSAKLNPVSVGVGSFALANLLAMTKSTQDLKAQPGEKSVDVILEFGPVENYLMFLVDGAPTVNGIFMSDGDKMSMYQLEELEHESCQRMIDRMAMQVKQAVSMYQSRHPGTVIDRLQVVSSLPNIEKVMRCLERSLDPLKVVVLNPFSAFKQHKSVKLTHDLKLNPSSVSPVIGMAGQRLPLFGSLETDGRQIEAHKVNLLPGREKVVATQRWRFVGAAILWVLGATAIAHAGLSEISRAIQLDTLRPIVLEYERLSADKASLTKVVADFKSQKQKLDVTLRASEQIKSNQRFLYNVLKDVNRSLPDGIWFEKMSYKDNSILVTGKAGGDPAILDFIRRLSSSKNIDRATLNKASVIGDKEPGLKLFELSIELNESAMLANGQEGQG